MTITRTSQGAKTLPQEYYTSPDVHARERERIFARRWICVGLAAELPARGSFLRAEVAGESRLVVRDHERGGGSGTGGEIRAFYNVCRHRGTRLCEAAAGNVGKHIVCPYHAWAYDLDGQLASAPIMSDVEGFDAADYPLHDVATAVWEGMIFVNLDPDPEPFELAFAPVLNKFRDWNLSALVPVHQTTYDVRANWKLMVQNYSECYHCPSLHPVLNKLTPFRDSANDLEEGAILGGPMKLSEGAESMTMHGRACAAPFPHLDDEQRRLVYYYVFFPSMFLSIMPDYVLVHRCLPRDAAHSTIICQWLFPPEAVSAPSFDASGAIDFWDMTNRQDWHICAESQLGIESRVYRPGPYANLESMLAAIDREYLRQMDDSQR